MARPPVIPTGYREENDFVLQTVTRTAEMRQYFSQEEMIAYMETKFGAPAQDIIF